MSLLPDGTVLPLEAVLGRRDFCRTLVVGGAALVTLGAGGCGEGEPAAPLDGGKSDTSSAQDMAQAAGDMAAQPDLTPPADLSQSQPDLTGQRPDLTSGDACPPNGAILTNLKPADFKINTATRSAMASSFVCRDNGGLFAVSEICPHNGCPVAAVNGGAGGFSCPCHQSMFTATGAFVSGPAGRALDRFALCLDSNGNVGINKLQNVAANKRYNF